MEKNIINQILGKCFQSIPFPTFLLNDKGEFVYCNKHFLKDILCEEHLSIKNETISNFKNVFQHDYIEQFQNINQIVMSNGSYEHEIEVKSKDGKISLFNEWKIKIEDDFSNEKFIVGYLYKIEGRKKQWEKLSKNNALLTALLENSTDLIYFKDLQSRFIKVSKAFIKRQNLELKDLLGKTDFDLFGKTHATEAFLDEQRIIQTGEAIIGKEEYEDWADGKKTWVSTSKMPLYSAEGKIIGTFGISRDITKQKQNELYKQNSLAFFTTLSTVSSIFLAQGATNFEYALTRVLEELSIFFKSKKSYAYYSDEKTNHLIKISEFPCNGDLEPHYHLIKDYKYWYEKLTIGETVFDQRSYDASPELKYLEENNLSHIIIVPLMNYVSLAGFISFECEDDAVTWPAKFNDLFKVLSEIVSNAFLNSESEKYRLEAEEEMLKLLRALNQSTDMILILNKEAIIEYINFRYSEITGFSYDDVYLKKLNFFLPEYNSQYNYEKILVDVLAGNKWEGKFKQTNKEGKTIWTHVSFSPIRNSHGEITNILAIMEDITEKMIDESRRAISQKLESIGQLAAGIAHEINTPMQFIGDNTTFLQNSLTPINEFLTQIRTIIEKEDKVNNSNLVKEYEDLLEKYEIEYLMEETQQAVKQTLSGVRHVSKIVKAMKDFSHPGEREKTYSDINHGIEVTGTISKNEWKYVSDLELKLDPNIPKVNCYQDELNQVVLGMIINSAHAIEEKKKLMNFSSGKILIETYQENNNVIIKISDNGMGIKEELQPKIFDPFFTTKEVGKGTGQGLTIAHDLIVNKHGGTLDVKSTYGEGTTFIITIPIDGNKVNE